MSRKMRDSGIAWIGEVPDGWGVERGKFILKLLERPVRDDDGVITCFRDGEVTLRSKRREEGFTFSEKECGYQGIEPGDLVVHGMDGFAGSIGISDSRGKATPVLNVLDSDRDKKFLMYFLRSAAHLDVFVAMATGIRVRSCDLRWSKLSEFRYVDPSLLEQQAIAAYLDRACGKIDGLREKVEKQIAALEEYKKSVITEAVTGKVKVSDKGVEKRDPKTMKPSGVEWIGEVPEGWRATRISFSFESIGSGTTPKSNHEDYYDGGEPWLQSGDLHGGHVSRTAKTVTQSALVDCGLRIYKAPFIAIAMYGASIANTVIVDIDACTNQACCTLSGPQSSMDLIYCFYSIRAARSELLIEAVGGTQPNINRDVIRRLKIPRPPHPEQEAIAAYLDKKCAAIDETVAKCKKQLDNLAEYKKSLIYECVTGKLEVE